MLFIILLLILNVLINFKKVDRKINDITKYKEDIVFLEDRYNNILKIDGDNDKLNNSNNDYNNKIGIFESFTDEELQPMIGEDFPVEEFRETVEYM